MFFLLMTKNLNLVLDHVSPELHPRDLQFFETNLNLLDTQKFTHSNRFIMHSLPDNAILESCWIFAGNSRILYRDDSFGSRRQICFRTTGNRGRNVCDKHIF